MKETGNSKTIKHGCLKIKGCKTNRLSAHIKITCKSILFIKQARTPVSDLSSRQWIHSTPANKLRSAADCGSWALEQQMIIKHSFI